MWQCRKTTGIFAKAAESAKTANELAVSAAGRLKRASCQGGQGGREGQVAEVVISHHALAAGAIGAHRWRSLRREAFDAAFREREMSKNAIECTPVR